MLVLMLLLALMLWVIPLLRFRLIVKIGDAAVVSSEEGTVLYGDEFVFQTVWPVEGLWWVIQIHVPILKVTVTAILLNIGN